MPKPLNLTLTHVHYSHKFDLKKSYWIALYFSPFLCVHTIYLLWYSN